MRVIALRTHRAAAGPVPEDQVVPLSSAVAAACFRARLAGEPSPAGERTARVPALGVVLGVAHDAARDLSTCAASGPGSRGGRRHVRPPAGPRGRAGRRLARRAAWRERPRKICGQKDTPTADGHVLVAAPAGYFAAFFLRSAQEAVIRSETAFFSSAVIGRRFLVGLASDAVSATGVAAAAGRREEERRAAGFAGAEVPSILSTSFNALISACRRSISLWRSAIAFAITLISFPRGCIVRRSTRSS